MGCDVRSNAVCVWPRVWLTLIGLLLTPPAHASEESMNCTVPYAARLYTECESEAHAWVLILLAVAGAWTVYINLKVDLFTGVVDSAYGPDHRIFRRNPRAWFGCHWFCPLPAADPKEAAAAADVEEPTSPAGTRDTENQEELVESDGDGEGKRGDIMGFCLLPWLRLPSVGSHYQGRKNYMLDDAEQVAHAEEHATMISPRQNLNTHPSVRVKPTDLDDVGRAVLLGKLNYDEWSYSKRPNADNCSPGCIRIENGKLLMRSFANWSTVECLNLKTYWVYKVSSLNGHSESAAPLLLARMIQSTLFQLPVFLLCEFTMFLVIKPKYTFLLFGLVAFLNFVAWVRMFYKIKASGFSVDDTFALVPRHKGDELPVYMMIVRNKHTRDRWIWNLAMVSCRGLLGVRKEVLDKYRQESGKDYLDQGALQAMTAEKKCSYIDLLTDPDVGPATHFLSHTWSQTLQEKIDALSSQEQLERNRFASRQKTYLPKEMSTNCFGGKPTPTYDFNVRKQTIPPIYEERDRFYWIDAFCVNQHDVMTGERLKDYLRRWGPTNAMKATGKVILAADDQWDSKIVNGAMQQLEMGKGVPLSLTRAWCIYEMYRAFTLEPIIQIRVAIENNEYEEDRPSECKRRCIEWGGPHDYYDQCVELFPENMMELHVDVKSARTTVSAHKAAIDEVVAEIGVDKVNAAVLRCITNAKREAIDAENKLKDEDTYNHKVMMIPRSILALVPIYAVYYTATSDTVSEFFGHPDPRLHDGDAHYGKHFGDLLLMFALMLSAVSFFVFTFKMLGGCCHVFNALPKELHNEEVDVLAGRVLKHHRHEHLGLHHNKTSALGKAHHTQHKHNEPIVIENTRKAERSPRTRAKLQESTEEKDDAFQNPLASTYESFEIDTPIGKR